MRASPRQATRPPDADKRILASQECGTGDAAKRILASQEPGTGDAAKRILASQEPGTGDAAKRILASSPIPCSLGRGLRAVDPFERAGLVLQGRGVDVAQLYLCDTGAAGSERRLLHVDRHPHLEP